MCVVSVDESIANSIKMRCWKLFVIKMMNEVRKCRHLSPLRPYRSPKNTVLSLSSQGREHRNDGMILKLLQFVPKSFSWISLSYKLGCRHNFCCGGPISNPRPILVSSAQTTRGMILDFCCKTSKHARLTSHCKHVFSRRF